MTLRFAAPVALEEALTLLAADPAARPVAGGTDLVVAAGLDAAARAQRMIRRGVPAQAARQVGAEQRRGRAPGQEISAGRVPSGPTTLGYPPPSGAKHPAPDPDRCRRSRGCPQVTAVRRLGYQG